MYPIADGNMIKSVIRAMMDSEERLVIFVAKQIH